MDVSADLISMVKTNKKGFYKDTIYNLTKDWTGGSYLMLRSKPMVPRGRPLITIGYKYNVWKLLFLLLQKTQVAQRQVLTICLSTLTSFLMLPISLLLSPFPYISSLDILMRLTPTTNKGSLIWNWISSGLLSVFGCC